MLLLFCWLLLLFLLLLWFGFWHLIFTLCRAQVGYLHFLSAWKRCYSSLCNTSWFEQMVFALWYNVPTTLYFDGIVWWLSHCKYKSVCVGFQYTEVWRLPSSLGVITMSKKGMDPSVLVSSQVNFILGLMEFKYSWKLFLCCFLMIVHAPSTNSYMVVPYDLGLSESIKKIMQEVWGTGAFQKRTYHQKPPNGSKG